MASANEPIASPWLDLVLARPAFGVLLNPVFETEAGRRLRITPLIDEWLGKGRLAQINVDEASGKVQVVSKGLAFSLSNTDVVFESVDPGSLEQVHGQRARMRYETPEALTYSEACTALLESVEAVLPYCIDPKRPRTIQRIGVVATCSFDQETLPPGLTRVLEHFSSPWRGDFLQCGLKFSAPLMDNDTITERCLHTIDVTTGAQGAGLILDWQRVYKQGRPLKSDGLRTLLESSLRDASRYFNVFASGELAF